MRKLILCLIVIICQSFYLLAQDPTNYIRTDLIPNSPNASAINKYGFSAINLATGTPNLSIPLFNVQGRDIGLPISLNYHYDGFKPNQITGWVGLGWSLSAGGVITKSIRGTLDGSRGSGSNYGDTYAQTRINHNISPEFLADEQIFIEDITLGYVDAEIDQYSFNFAGYSGKFVFFRDTVYISPAQKLKITGTDGTGFQVTTEDGTKYTFLDQETTYPKSGSEAAYSLPSSYVSSWFLSSIENAAGTEIINLSYESDGTILHNGTYTQSYKRESGFTEDNSVLYDAKITYPTKIASLRLSQISSDKYTVNFSETSSTRSDVSMYSGSARALDKIVIVCNGDTLKAFKFKIGYFGDSYLKLNALEEYGSNYPDTTNVQSHSFEYNAASVGAKASAKVDHYGYYKGGDFEGYAIPDFMRNAPIGTGSPNRDPTFSSTAMGALLSVTYPTGGTSTFEYEQNLRYNGLEYPEIPRDTAFQYIRNPYPNPNDIVISSFNTSIFELDHSQTVRYTITRTPKSLSAAPDSTIHSQHGDVFIYRDSLGTYTLLDSIRLVSDTLNAGGIFYRALGLGKYQVRFKLDYNEDEMGLIVSCSDLGLVPIEGKEAGGIRLKSVTNIPKIGNPMVTAYKYVNDSGLSTGISPGLTYSSNALLLNYYSFSGLTEKNYTMFNSAVGENELSTQPHYYSSVLVKQISSTDTLVTRNDFVSYNNLGGGIKPVRIVQYKKSGAVYVPITKQEYTYEIDGGRSFRYMRAYQSMQATAAPGYAVAGDDKEFAASSDISFSTEQIYNTIMREVSYEGTDSLVKQTNYSYDLADTKNLLISRTTLPNGEQLITKYKYPESYTIGLNGDFISAHVFGPAWEMQSWRKVGSDSVLLSAQFTKYDSLLFKPTKVYAISANGITAFDNETKTGSKYNTLLSDSRFEERVSFTYDADARLTSQKLKHGITSSYQYAVSPGLEDIVWAAVKNAMPTEFYHENFEEGINAIGIAHSGKFYNTGDFAVSWTIPNGRSYMLTYWYLDGSVWKYHEQAYTTSTTLTLGSAIDDVSIYPVDAELSHYTYYPGIGVASTTDTKGLSRYFEYDDFLRLKNAKDQNGDIVKNYQYNYAQYGNTVHSQSFTRNNCASGYVGSSVAYTVAANTFVATTEARANALALADIAANGQAYANANGTCVGPGSISYLTPLDTFDVTLYNTSTAETFYRTISGRGTITGLTVGYYDILITSASNNYYDYSIGSYTDYIDVAYFTGVPVSTTPLVLGIN
jgi:hypothetical protein